MIGSMRDPDGSVPIMTVTLRPYDFDEKPIWKHSRYFLPEEIRGEFLFRIGDCQVTRCIATSSDSVTDAVYSIIVDLHDFIWRMHIHDSTYGSDPLRGTRYVANWGIKCYYQRSALDLTWNNIDDVIDILFFPEGSTTGPVIPPTVRKSDFIGTVQAATADLIHQLENHPDRRTPVEEYVGKLQELTHASDKILQEIRKPLTSPNP